MPRRPPVTARVRAMRDRIRVARVVWRTNAALVPPPPSAFAAFGTGSIIVPPARIEAPKLIAIGDQVLIHEHAWLLARASDEHEGPTLTIGDRAWLNRFIKIVALGSVQLGEGVIIGDHAYISDVEYVPGHADVDPVMRPLTEPAPVVLEAHCALGVGVIVKPGVTIGERAYVGAGSVVSKDVPPRTLVVGAPARVVRRYDPETGRW
ncbi:MAG: hypothetical protein QOI67_1074 [Gaiellaceae bacterium]|jgi:acetyltransferase-like isoleucine patch superfamily enzyme|nr:hypothetical protein [Gaiellaceae bacterium]